MKGRSISQLHRGSVLVVVLWASLGLVSIALLFGQSMLLNYRGVDNDVAGRQADQAIEGAIRYAGTLLAEVETKGNLPELTSYEGEAVSVGEAEFWYLGRSDGDLNGTTREYALVDEAAKLNVNAVPQAVLELLPGMTPELAAEIVAWRTSVSGGTPSSTAKGGPFESVEELALVPGMTREILYGEDTNLNGVLDANEDDGEASLPPDSADGKIDPGLAEYLTVFTKEPANQPGGSDLRVNVSRVTPDAINEINSKLDADVAITPGNYTSLSDFVSRGLSTLSEEEANKVVGYFVAPQPRAPDQPLLVGMVNVNTASEAVLTALLGDQTLAADLVGARASRTLPSTGFKWAADILQGAASQNAAYLTGSSYQVAADVAAVGRHGRGYRRTRVVFDLAGDEPKIIYRRNLAPLGWALGREVREQLALKKDLR